LSLEALVQQARDQVLDHAPRPAHVAHVDIAAVRPVGILLVQDPLRFHALVVVAIVLHLAEADIADDGLFLLEQRADRRMMQAVEDDEAVVAELRNGRLLGIDDDPALVVGRGRGDAARLHGERGSQE
jgi:hypothetical protein